MDARLSFVLCASAMCGLALVFAKPVLKRSQDRHDVRLRATVLLGLPGAALLLYLWLGDFAALGAQRQALSAALSASAEAGPAGADAGLYSELQTYLSRQPDDARALVLKARLDMQADRFDLAAQAYQRALSGNSRTTRDAGLWLEYAEAVGLQEGGRLSGQAQPLIDKALTLAPEHPKALDLAGSAALERGDFAAALSFWQRLLMPTRQELSAAIAQLQQRTRAPSSKP